MLKKSSIWLIAPALVLAVVAVISYPIWRPIGVIVLEGHGGVLSSEEGDIAADIPVEVRAYLTGWVKAPANILIDQRDPRTPEEITRPIWVPSLAYVVKHPKSGVAVLDTGLRAGQCDYGFQPFYWVPCRNERGADLVSQLKSDGVEPEEIRFVVPSHLHGDHISGMDSLLDYTNAPVLMTHATLRSLKSPGRVAKGIPTSMLSSNLRVRIIDEGFRRSRLGIDVYDVFGDGSLRLFPTPGHTEGHISALARGTEGDILFTFDASHLAANLHLGIPSGAVSSEEAAIMSLKKIASLDDQAESIQIIYGHEPGQWDCVKKTALLDGATDLCGRN
ncbi:MBL fold metallo-hydrolase [Marinobacter confluentis]|uniref:MBL fold metallo-hydrolase n=1 Tax=Marinobacter confluentis TaxID=1697557 RepID=A0A4Z1BPW0_9GAMM|nr:MBL fold metallo-hydrolase [Marinobacter confluentis]TGN39111.1 MBL fold metallo-hydrolase [Marinobacter confluentis]